MENSKYVAKLKEQLQIINSMIDEAEEGTPDEPSEVMIQTSNVLQIWKTKLKH